MLHSPPMAGSKRLPRPRQRHGWFATLCVVIACAAGAPAHVAQAAQAELVRLLAYDRSAPLNLKVVKREYRLGVLVEDIVFDSVAGAGPVKATLVRPTLLDAPYAGVVWGHWFESSAANSNRSQFLREATALGRRGVVSVLPDTLWTQPTWFSARSWRNDFAHTAGQAKDFRRALDVLLAQSGVDPERIGFVGHDFSAMHGALIAGVETRMKAYVLIAGTSRWADWTLFGAADGVPLGGELTAYLAQLAKIDPVTALPFNKARLFMQFGEDDVYTPRSNFMAFYSAGALKTSRIASYEARHPMDATIIRIDRHAWLSQQLGLLQTSRLTHGPEEPTPED